MTHPTGSLLITNALRDHLLENLRDVDADISKTNGKLSELTKRRAFLESLVQQCKANGIELRDSVKAAPVDEPISTRPALVKP